METEPTASAVVVSDPYSLEDINGCKSAIQISKWTNKQRTLVLGSRGIGARQRHLMDDIKALLPHSKSEPKWEKHRPLMDINEVCEMTSYDVI